MLRYRVFGECVAAQLRNDLAARKDQNPVTDRGKLVVIRRRNQNASATVCSLVQPVPDRLPGADIDALRRFVQQHQFRVENPGSPAISAHWPSTGRASPPWKATE